MLKKYRFFLYRQLRTSASDKYKLTAYPIDSMTLSCQCLSATMPALKLCLVSFFCFLELRRRGMLVCPCSSSLAIVFCEATLPISDVLGKWLCLQSKTLSIGSAISRSAATGNINYGCVNDAPKLLQRARVEITPPICGKQRDLSPRKHDAPSQVHTQTVDPYCIAEFIWNAKTQAN